MQALAYEGYFNNGVFYTAGKAMRIPEKRRVFITILDEAESVAGYDAAEQKESAQEWLNDFFNILSTATVDLDEITTNVKHFKNMPNLVFVDWTQ